MVIAVTLNTVPHIPYTLSSLYSVHCIHIVSLQSPKQNALSNKYVLEDSVKNPFVYNLNIYVYS